MKDELPFNAQDLPMIYDRAYHLCLRPEEMAKDIIMVGDPERVPFIADEFLDTKEVDRYHRGLRTITGYAKDTGLRVSIVTSGMGTPSLEIVLNEIVALNEIDFNKKERKKEYERINIIRVGTSGGLQSDTEPGTLIITDYAVGLDNTGLFYNSPYYDERCKVLEDRVRGVIDSVIPDNTRFKGRIFPYASMAHQDIVSALVREASEQDIKYKKGITVSNSGFFANQGRAASRISPTIPDIDRLLASLDTGIEGLKIENMEMEASFLLHFMGALRYRAGVICPVIDNRHNGVFLGEYAQHIKDATSIALKALHALSSK